LESFALQKIKLHPLPCRYFHLLNQNKVDDVHLFTELAHMLDLEQEQAAAA
jgi:hypothetical protein